MTAPDEPYPCYCLPGPARCDDPFNWCDRPVRGGVVSDCTCGKALASPDEMESGMCLLCLNGPVPGRNDHPLAEVAS